MKLVDAIRTITDHEGRQLRDHPSPDELLSYHLRLLPADAADRIREHLGVCRDCSELVLALASESDEPHAAPIIADEEVSHQFTLFQQRLRAEPDIEPTTDFEDAAPQPSVSSASRESESRIQRKAVWGRRGVPYAIAAVLFISLGISLWTNYQLTRPWVDPALADLNPLRTQREADVTEEVVVSAEDDQLVLILNLSDIHHFPRYRFVVSEADGQVVWRHELSASEPRSSFVLGMRKGFLSQGEYLFRIDGLRDGQAEEIFSERRRITLE